MPCWVAVILAVLSVYAVSIIGAMILMPELLPRLMENRKNPANDP